MAYVTSSPPLAILTGNSIQIYVHTNKNVSITQAVCYQTKPMQKSMDNLLPWLLKNGTCMVILMDLYCEIYQLTGTSQEKINKFKKNSCII